MDLNDTCEGCIYSHPAITDDEEDVIMKCRRYPPIVYVFEEEVCQAFPDANTRCGEYHRDRFSILIDPPVEFGIDG